jgi:Glycoside-hydrolase family GH114
MFERSSAAIRPRSLTARRVRLTAVLAVAAAFVVQGGQADAAGPALPPVHAGFDYQIGGAYTPPSGVTVVSRDNGDKPAAGLYNICYINAFQAQEGDEDQWGDLLLHDADGNVVYDKDWNEALLDVSTAAKRQQVADRIDAIIDTCAAKGYNAVEPDNYDSYTRSEKLLTSSEAEDYIALLSAHAHADGLAIAQKNTVELAPDHASTGLDFAIAEECGYYNECDGYIDAYGSEVIDIEYTDQGLSKACSKWGDRISVVERDEDVNTPSSGDYVRKTCASL